MLYMGLCAFMISTHTVAPYDYIALSAILEFEECETRKCEEIVIVDDLILEMEETFSFTLNRTENLDPRITLDPTEGDVVIVDNDSMLIPFKRYSVTLALCVGAEVSLEVPLYTVQEDVGVVEVCVIVSSPSISCPISFPFIVTFTTSDNSAGKDYYSKCAIIYGLFIHAVSPMDYGGESTVLMFDSCDVQSCLNISIIDDMVVEDLESFDITVGRAPGLDNRITLESVNGTVEITDNDGMLIVSEIV